MAVSRIFRLHGLDVIAGPCSSKQVVSSTYHSPCFSLPTSHCCQNGAISGDHPTVVPRNSLQRSQKCLKSADVLGCMTQALLRKQERRIRKGARIHASAKDLDYEPPAWEAKAEVPKEYWFAATEASKMLLHGPELETVLRDAVERADRSNLPRNTWLIFEPMFLEEHPGLKGVKKDMKGQVAAIVSTNQDWMIQIVKPMLPGVVIGKFRIPSKYIKDPLASAIRASPNVPSGAGIWH